jgi:hypothetical protein
VTGIDEINGIIRAARQAHREFANTSGVSADTRQAVAQAVRFLIADLESAKAITGASLATVDV